MSANSKIEWTHHTFNPWWGCTKVSPGCAHCYAEGVSVRWGFDVWGDNAQRRFFAPGHWLEPVKQWNVAAREARERHRVFCGSMCDVFEAREDLLEPRRMLWNLIELTPHLDWLLLTKRPENIGKMTDHLAPLPKNVWLGTSVENQKLADERIPSLLQTPAAVRFLSVEPLLGPVTLRPEWLAALDWVIVGGESGAGARACYTNWIDRIVEQCAAVGVPAFVKQLGSNHRCDDGEFGDIRIHLKHKGGDIDQFPENLRVREFPEVRP